MPLFRRSDGDLVTGLSDSRRIMPYVMRKRNESIVFHTMQMEVAGTRAWLRKYNRAHPKNQHASLFYLYMYALAKSMNERPGANRFVSGGRIYQRKDVWLSYTAKKRIVDDSPLITVKLKFPPDEKFSDCMRRMYEAVDSGRTGQDSAIDRELRLLLRLPAPLLRIVLAAGRWLDRFNLLPAALIEPDPLFATAFLTNDGSVGIANAHHHLYEHGTCSLFAVFGNVKKTTVVDASGQIGGREVLEVYWSFDERVTDGLYCAHTLTAIRRFMEDPGQYISWSASRAENGAEGAEVFHQASQEASQEAPHHASPSRE